MELLEVINMFKINFSGCVDRDTTIPLMKNRPGYEMLSRHDPDRQNRDRDPDPDLHQKLRSRSRSLFEKSSAIRSRSQLHDRAIFWVIFLFIDLWKHW